MKIAHISDFHLRSNLPGTSSISRRLSRKMPGLIETAVERIRAESPNLVVVTGDLVDHPFYGMHDPALLALGEKDLHLVRELFQPLSCPVAFLYGNHDHPESFHRVFGDLPHDFGVANHRILLFFDDEVENHFPQRLGTQRERFLAALADDDPRPQIHLQHYLIAPERNQGYPHTYREAESLKTSLLADPRVRLVLNGHYHRGESLFQEGHVFFSTAPAFSEPPHPFRIYEISENEIVQTEIHLHNPGRPRQKAVFLDRDGNINPQAAYRTGPEPFRLIDGVGEALARLQEAGYALVVVTNQTAVGQGYVTIETVGAVNDKMAALLAPFDVELDGIYARYHSRNAPLPQHQTDTPETKPSPAMLHQAAEDLHLDLAASFMIGDQKSDLEAGHNAGCRAILVETGGGAKTRKNLAPEDADFIAADLPDAATWILRQT
ncbi:MAG: HAD-IIIA family hydrolase [bacterium]|nr:HAD-IIIA family hydrolase [bacterium]